MSLLIGSAILVHLFDGLIEMHFHFFVVVAIVSLYQSWPPYLLGLVYVLLHHGVMGTLAPDLVYNHPWALAHPLGFAAIHAGFVLAESVACVLYWRLTEDALIAEREQRQRQEDANEALAMANAKISDLVGMMAHDLRSPATVVSGYAEEALERWEHLDDDVKRTCMRRIAQAGRSLQELLESGLTVSALDTNELVAHPEPVRLDEAVRQCLAAMADPLPGVELRLGAESALVDRMHLTQVLTNLVTNARKYGEGPYRIEAGASGPDHVRVVVSDSGPGVPEEFVPRLFMRYTRSEQARRAGQRGTGLGLYIVRSLVQANAGRIDYTGRAGVGGEFTLTLPRGPRPAPGRRDALVDAEHA